MLWAAALATGVDSEPVMASTAVGDDVSSMTRRISVVVPEREMTTTKS